MQKLAIKGHQNNRKKIQINLMLFLYQHIYFICYGQIKIAVISKSKTSSQSLNKKRNLVKLVSSNFIQKLILNCVIIIQNILPHSNNKNNFIDLCKSKGLILLNASAMYPYQYQRIKYSKHSKSLRYINYSFSD